MVGLDALLRILSGVMYIQCVCTLQRDYITIGNIVKELAAPKVRNTEWVGGIFIPDFSKHLDRN